MAPWSRHQVSRRMRTMQAGDKAYKCSMCEYSTNVKYSLVAHVRRHTGEKPYKCTVCEYAARTLSGLYGHLYRRHPGMKPFKCTVCDDTFVTQTKLRVHLRLHIHGVPQRKSKDVKRSMSSDEIILLGKCTTGNSGSTLKPHQGNISALNNSPGLYADFNQEIGGPNLQCLVCEKRFEAQSKLQRHLSQVHIGTSPNIPRGLTGRGKVHVESRKQPKHQYADITMGRVVPTGGSSHRYHHAEIQGDTGGYGDDKPYKCMVCEYSCNRNDSLVKHLRRHAGEKPYSCNICDYAGTDISTLYTHMRRKHRGTKPFACTLCDNRFLTPTQLRQHLFVHISGDGQETCGNVGTVTADQLPHDTESSPPDKTTLSPSELQCDVCSKCFDTEMELQRHLRKAHIGTSPSKNRSMGSAERKKETEGGKNYNGYRPRNRSNVFRIRQRNRVLKPHMCTVCEYSCWRRQNLAKHERCHTGEKPFKCMFCDYAGRQESHLYKHMELIHPNNKSFKCTVCHEAFVIPSQLRHHLGLHMDQSPDQEDQQAVRVSPDEDQKFQCTVCSKHFAAERTLRKHLRDAHSATISSKGATRMPRGLNHQKKGVFQTIQTGMLVAPADGQTDAPRQYPRHLMYKSYMCTVCGCSLQNTFRLIRHLRSHANIRLHKCRFCEYAGRDSTDVVRHMKRRH